MSRSDSTQDMHVPDISVFQEPKETFLWVLEPTTLESLSSSQCRASM